MKDPLSRNVDYRRRTSSPIIACCESIGQGGYCCCRTMRVQIPCRRYQFKIMILTVDDDGVLTFPEGMFDKLGWEEGDILEWHPQEDGSILLVKAEDYETQD